MFALRFRSPVIATSLIFAAFMLMALARCVSNLPWVDEGWFFDASYNWLKHGQTGISVIDDRGLAFEGIKDHEYWQPPVYLVCSTVWLKLFGPSLQSFRVLSLAAGLALLFSWLSILKHFRVPLLFHFFALTLIAFDYAVVRASSDGRMDMLAAAFGFGAVAVYLRWREKHFTWAVFLSQTLLVLGGLTHPLGGLVYLSVLLYFFLEARDWARVTSVDIILALLPYAVGVTGWSFYILQDPQAFVKVFLHYNVSGRFHGLSHPLLALQDEVVNRYLVPFGLYRSSWIFKLKLLIPIVYLLSAPLVLLIRPVRRQTFLAPFLAMWSIACLSVFLMDGYRFSTYLVHIFPFYAILLAAFLYWLAQRSTGIRVSAFAFGAAFILLEAGASLYLFVINPYRDQYQTVVSFALQHAKPGDRIVGTAELGFGLGFDRIHDDVALGYYVHQKPDVIILC